MAQKPNRAARRRFEVIQRQTGFSVGQTVKLRSGGAVMTIEAMEGAIATCVWHNKDGGGHAAKYQSTSLEPA